MAILGNNVKGASSNPATAGRMFVSKYTLASASTLTELHGFISPTTAMRVVMYADSAGNPGNLVAYTNPFTGADAEYSQAGFSVALPAGDYWIGTKFTGATGLYWWATTGSTCVRVTVGDPPPSPFGTPTAVGSQSMSCWAVVGAGGGGGPSFVPTVTVI